MPVNEDFLFDVDIEERELAPVYWLGPVYDVRRGSWFYQEGSTLRPCEENLAAQLEEGYLKVKPWTYPTASRSRSNSGTGPEITPKASRENLKAPKPSKENLKAAAASQTENTPKAQPAPVPQHQPQTYRLFGTYMNSRFLPFYWLHYCRRLSESDIPTRSYLRKLLEDSQAVSWPAPKRQPY